jgi:Rieske 2Fe-2S family protein
VHPALNALTPYQASDNDFTSGPILGGPMYLADGVESMTRTSCHIAAPRPRLDSRQRRSVYYYTVFPSFFLSLHPDYVMIHRLQPVAVDRTLVHCDFFCHPDEVARPSFDPAPAVEFWDLTNRQDWHVCELVQQGAVSREFRPGPYAELESVVAAFDRHYLGQVHPDQDIRRPDGTAP